MSDYDDIPPDDPYEPAAPKLDAAALIEQQVIGSAMRFPRSASELQREVSGADFHDLRLGRIFDGVIAAALAGEPVDYLTVWGRLTAWDVRGIDLPELSRWSDAAVSPVLGAAHAATVRKESMRRSLAGIGETLRDSADDPAVTAARVAEQLREIRDATPVSGKSVRWLREILDVPEDDDAYDWVIPNMLERQDRVMISAGEGVGKALALDTPLATPTGWTTMGDVRVGDQVVGADGKPTRVVAATEVMRERECFRVEFSDGSEIIADAEHLWLTDDYRSRTAAAKLRSRPLLPHGTDQSWKSARAEVRTTRQIADTLRARNGFCLNHSICATKPLELGGNHLPVDPYTLGAWLGDGATASDVLTLNFHDAPHIESRIPYSHHRVPSHSMQGSVGVRIEGGTTQLRAIGVIGAKHIPTSYLRGSAAHRWALLRGLMDTDGYISDARGKGRGSGAAYCELTLMNPRLAADALELILSLGIIVTLQESDAKLNGRVVGRRQRITFQSPENPFTLPRKAERWFPPRTQRSRRRFITAVVPVESVPVRCIQVDNDDRLYLAGRSMIPTHNTTFLRQMAVMSAAGVHPFDRSLMDPVNVLVIDAENSERQWRRAARRLTETATIHGRRDPRDHMAVHCVPVMDITKPNDLGLIHRWIDETQPALLLLGPLYRMTSGSLNKEEDAKPVLNALDSIRERNVTMLIEVHAGLDKDSSGERGLRPRGSSTLLGWPEFGLGIRRNKVVEGRVPTFSLVRWRGDRDRRDWPTRLIHGETFPWEKSF